MSMINHSVLVKIDGVPGAKFTLSREEGCDRSDEYHLLLCISAGVGRWMFNLDDKQINDLTIALMKHAREFSTFAPYPQQDGELIALCSAKVVDSARS